MKNLVKVCLERDEQLLRKCRESYEGLADFRLRRNRCKDFAYGRQWGDTYRMPSGRVVSEEENILENGTHSNYQQHDTQAYSVSCREVSLVSRSGAGKMG